MCLSTVDFVLDKNGVGTGYKIIAYHHFNFDNSKPVSLKPTRETKYYSKNWIKAKSWDTTNFEYSIDGKKYYPGFHIFLEEKHAKNYSNYGVVVEVKFKGIRAFGQNKAGDYGKGACIISEYMRISKILGYNNAGLFRGN